MIGFLLIAAAVLFIFGFMAATSRFLFVALAWSLCVLCMAGAGFVWLGAQFFRRG